MSDYPGAPAGAPGDGGPDLALAELGRAITRAAGALAAVPGDDDATAYRCARALDAALGDLADLLRAAPGICKLGDPGPAVSARLAQRQAELSARRAEVTAHRARLDELAGTERSLAELTAEAGQLSARVSELERVQRLAAEIPGLRTQVRALDEAVTAAGLADAPQLGTRIAAAAGQFAALTARQREAIGAEAGRMVAAAEQAAADLAGQRDRRDAAAADLARSQSEADQLAAEHREMLPVLTAWHQADTDLAEGLRGAGGAGGSALDTVQTELARIRQQLTGLDSRLRPLLADHSEAYESARRVRPF